MGLIKTELMCAESKCRFPEHLWQGFFVIDPKELSLVIYSSIGMNWNDLTIEESTLSKQIKLQAFKWGYKEGETNYHKRNYHRLPV